MRKKINNPFFSLLISALLILLSINAVFALEGGTANANEENKDNLSQIIINSRDWKDVYSGLLFSKLTRTPIQYVAEEIHGTWLYQAGLIKRGIPLLVVNSEDESFIKGYEEQLKENNFIVDTTITGKTTEINLELATRAIADQKIENLVVVDGTLGHTAIIVASYALVTKSWVVFANEQNSEDVKRFIKKNNFKHIQIIGRVDNKVREDFKQFNPEIIHKRNKYDLNVEIARRFMKFKKTGQVVITPGDRLETTLFNTEFPLLLIGPGDPLEQIITFIKEEGVTTLVLVGHELVEAGLKLKEQTNTRYVMKYAKGVAGEVYSLDYFPTPNYNPDIEISKVNYNTLTKQLEVVFKNTREVFAYVKSLSHELLSGEKTDPIVILGDENAFFMGANEETTQIYSVDLTEHLNDVIVMESKFVFGDTPGSMDRSKITEKIIEFISFTDRAEIRVEDIVYNKRTQRFEIKIKNIGPVKTYVLPELVDLIQNDEPQTFSGLKKSIPAGATAVITIKVRLDAIDLADNPRVKLIIRYGERPETLFKAITDTYALKTKKIVDTKIIILALLIIILVWLVRKRKKYHHAKAG